MRRATVQQTSSDINAANYIVLEAGLTVYEVSSNYISKELMTPLRMRGSSQEYSFHRNIVQGAVSIKQYDVMDLYKGEEKQGYICGNAIFFFGSKTYTMEWAGRKFTMYDVGLGSQEIKLPIYEDNRQVALVEKDTFVQNMLDSYEIYTIEDELFPMIALAALYYDRDNFSNEGKHSDTRVQSSTSFSLDDKQLARYDEGWVAAFLTSEEREARATKATKPIPKPLRMLLRIMPFIFGAVVLYLFYFILYK